MKDILWFKDISKNDVLKVGGKGAQLGEMFNLGIPVPQGFCISVNAYKRFLEETKIGDIIYDILDNLDVNDNELLHEASEKIQDMILEAEIPNDIANEIKESYNNLNVDVDIIRIANKKTLDIIKAGRDYSYVAIRSSANAEDQPTTSFAGQNVTFLNIKGADNVVNNVKKCWASLFTARCIFYRVENKLEHRKVLIAVVVQKMVNSTAAGVIFTMNPATNNDKEIVIEAGFGLGEMVVSGSITPDIYLINKDNLEIIDKSINKQEWQIVRDENLGRSVKKNLNSEGEKQKISDNIIKKLAEYAVELEKHYNANQDVEFAIEGSKIFIVQTRPVTTEKKVEEQKEKREEVTGEVLLTGIAAGPGVAKGIVKIVKDASELGKILDGDVLVAKMTNPDYVSAMKRAVAVVTDEGGISCVGGDTKVLTNKGFIDIKEVVRRFREGEEFQVLAYDSKLLQTCWKNIINCFNRKSKAVRISTSQTGKMEHNTLDITLDHKMYTFNGKELAKKELNKILDKGEMLCLIDKIPSLTGIDNPKLAYVAGALFSDGYIKVQNGVTGRPRRGRVQFTQKVTEEKEEFIGTVQKYFSEVFDEELVTYPSRISCGVIRGKEVIGEASDFICQKLKPAIFLSKISQNLEEFSLSLDLTSIQHFLAGLIDGDGCFYDNRLHLYVSDDKILQAVVICCLRLGIVPQVTVNRNIHHVQILENMDKILMFTKRVKGEIFEKKLGTKLFSARQIFENIVDRVNYKGRLKPYVNSNLLIDGNKIIKNILPMANEKEKEKLLRILNSNLRMHRVQQIDDLGEIEVFNLEVEAENELNHNFIAFTKKYTPLLISNCHAAIVGREMGLPVVVGTFKATEVLKEGMNITVDGYNGKIYSGEVSIEEPEEEIVEKEELETVTSVKVNVDMPEYAAKAAATGADGIGLLRCEFMLSKTKEHPYYSVKQKKEELVDELVNDIKQIASAFKGKSVWYRTSDFRTDEYKDLIGGNEEPHEDNPMMGWHGIRRDLDQTELLKAQFEAIKRVHDEGVTNVGVMIPLVTSVEEVRKAKKYLKEAGLEPLEEIEFGVMVETPAAVQIIEDLCKEGLDFISFGTNDLTQFTLAVDRNNANVQRLYDEMHPAVLKQLKYVIKICREYNVETSICGQAGSREDMVEWLIKQGIDSVSANIDAVANIRKVVYRTEKKMLLDAARSKE